MTRTPQGGKTDNRGPSLEGDEDETDWNSKPTGDGTETSRIEEGAPRSGPLQRQQPPPPKINSNNNNIHLNIEEKIGVCLDEFRCQHNNFTGILYVGPLGVVFLGRFLLFEWTVVLKWEEVTKVRRKDATGKAIRIESANTSSKQRFLYAPGFYDFEGFFDTQKVLETLIGLHNDGTILGDNTGNGNTRHKNFCKVSSRGSMVVSSSYPLRRSNSNPAERISSIFNFDDLSLDQCWGGDDSEGNLDDATDPNTATMEALQNQYSTKNALSNKNNNNDNSSSSYIRDALQTEVILQNPPQSGGEDGNNSKTKDRKRSSEDDNNTNSDVEAESSIPKPNKTKPLPTKTQLAEEWARICSDMEGYAEAPVRDREIPLEGDDLNGFVETFLEDGAPFSASRFMKEIVKDTDIQATMWVDIGNDTESNNETKSGGVRALTRRIDYTHPVNAPMAPPTARAHKEQTLRNFGNQLGLVVESNTVVSDVPMTDCFYVRDVLQVKRIQEGSSSRWLVNIRFEVVFVKSTMFRSLITRTSRSELIKFNTDLADYLSSNCSGRARASSSVIETPLLPTPPLSPPPVLPEIANASNATRKDTSKSSSYFDLFWRLVVVVVLVWMAQLQTRVRDETSMLRDELQAWKSTVQNLEETRALEQQSLRENLQQWQVAFQELETSRVVDQSLLHQTLQELQLATSKLEATIVNETVSSRQEWNAALATLKHETTAETRALKEECYELKSAVLELKSAVLEVGNDERVGNKDGTPTAPHEKGDEDDDDDDDNDPNDSEASSEDIRPRQSAAKPGIIKPRGPLLMEKVHDRNPGDYRFSGRSQHRASFEEMSDWEKLEQCRESCY